MFIPQLLVLFTKQSLYTQERELFDGISEGLESAGFFRFLTYCSGSRRLRMDRSYSLFRSVQTPGLLIVLLDFPLQNLRASKVVHNFITRRFGIIAFSKCISAKICTAEPFGKSQNNQRKKFHTTSSYSGNISPLGYNKHVGLLSLLSRIITKCLCV